jgi:hypothetical protein
MRITVEHLREAGMGQALQRRTWSAIGESLATRWGTKPSQARGIDIGTDDSGGTVLPVFLFN